MSFETGAIIIGLAMTAIGLIYTAHQIKEARKVTRGQFLLHLDELFQQHYEVHLALRPGGKWKNHNSGPQFAKDWAAVDKYMGLFERINILVNDGIVDIDTIDKLYGYRVHNLVRNPIINQAKLVEAAEDWQDFIELWHKLERARKRRASNWHRIVVFFDKFLRILGFR